MTNVYQYLFSLNILLDDEEDRGLGHGKDFVR